MASRLCPACTRSFPSGTAACPDHGKILRDDAVLGTSLCGHLVSGWLGEGLYSATEHRSGGPLGVRVLVPGPDLDAPGLLGELRAASALSEGGLLTPIDAGALPDGRLFYLFAWPRRGQTEPLRQVLQRAPRPLSEVIEIGVALCQALAPAHRAGHPHGLLSGETVLIQRGADQTLGTQATLLDLGLGKRVLRGAAPQTSDDIHALGALLYQMATGTPVQAPTAFSSHDELPSEFEAVVLRALAQRREDRHPSVAALQKDLEALEREDRRRLGPTAGRRSQVLPLLLAGACGVALAAMVLLVLLVRPGWVGVPRPTAAVTPVAPEPPVRPREPDDGDGPMLVAPAARARSLAVLADALRSPEPQERWQAAQIIGGSGDRRLRPMAEELLEDGEQRVAAHAAWALGLLGDRAAVVALGQVASDRQLDLETGVALTQLSDRRGLELLRGVLRTRPERERMEAALWLGENNEAEAWRALRKMLTHTQDDDPQQHLFLLGRLCRGRDQAACQQLRERLVSSGLGGRSRLLAGVGLMQAGDPQGYQVLHGLAADPAQRLAALRALAEGGLESDEERWLISAMAGEGGTPPEDRATAAEALGVAASFGALPQLEAALADKPPVLRWAAAASLLRLAWLDPRLLRRRATEWAPAGLQAPRAATRSAAAAVLAAAPAALAVPLLGRALSDRDADVRIAAALGLGQVGAVLPAAPGGEAAAVLASLSEVLKDRDGAVRVAAVQALGRLREQPPAQAMLRDQLERGTLLERVAAAASLNERDGSQRHVLRQALATPDVAVRLLAVREAARDRDTTQRASIYLAAMGDTADDVRLQAAVGLAALGDRRGLEALRGYGGLLLAQRLLARDALARLKEPMPTLDIVAALGAAGEGQRVGAMAVASDLLPETALSVLRRGLRDIAPPVRLAAVAAVGAVTLERRARQQLLLPVISDPDEAVQARASALLAELLGG